MRSSKQVVIGLLGPVLDAGQGANRWNNWRPTISLCQHEDFLVDRFELLYQKSFSRLVETVVADIRSVSPETEVVPVEVFFEDAWDFEEVYGELMDYAQKRTFDPDSESYFVHITTGTHVAQICLFLLTESRHIPGRLIQTSPPDRHETSVQGHYTIIDLDLSKYDRLAARHQRRQKDALSFLKSGIETRNRSFNVLIELIEHVAINTQAPLLLMGPTGAGKSQLARRIYELKQTRHQVAGPFIEVNCATIRGDAAMSSLFGHVKGAFTGAVKDRAGLLLSADHGILFLDEVGELGLDEQAMLLRALEEKRFLPVGSDKEVKSDFQLIAGTNRDLADAVKTGGFREDLLARINLWTFHLPGLCHRTEDIEPNLDYELEQYAQKHSRHVTMSKEVRSRFLEFACSPEAKWCANFRDLNACVIRMSTLAPGGRITSEILEQETKRLLDSWRSAKDQTAPQTLLLPILGKDRLESMDLFDQAQLAFVVEVCLKSASLSEAGRRLFAATRQEKKQANDADRLRKYLARFGLQWQDIHRKSLDK